MKNVLEYLQKLQEYVKGLTLQQRISYGGGLVILIGSLAFLAYLNNRVDYAPLFSGLAESDMGEIVQALKAKKIPYQVTQNRIDVPRDKVYETRLSLAADGIPKGSGVGFEIFDHQNLGTTEFVQKIDYQRALQGELARTIDGMSQVLETRVHLVMPVDSLFKDDQKPATAAIVLKLRPGGGPIKDKELQGIVHLVAASVRGLQEDRITVMSTDGRVLFTKQKEDKNQQLSATELGIKRGMEEDLSQRIQSMLERVVGPNKAMAKVAVELNMDQVQIAEDKYDPDSAVIRSQERTTENAHGGALEGEGNPDIQGKLLQNAPKTTSAQKSGTQSNRQTEVVNYEINKTSKRITQMPGSIDKLTVSVMVDGTYKPAPGPDGKSKMVYVPRSPEEIKSIKQLVQNAVGYNEARGDQITVVSIPFVTDMSGGDMVKAENKYLQFFQSWQKVIFNVVIGALVFFFVIRPFMAKFRQTGEEAKQLPAPEAATGTPEANALLFDFPVEQMTPRKKAAALVQYAPDKATDIIKQWLRDEV
ncbi:MAG: flagellar basal-body MS-ring/collar protein FliF [Syntrophobacteraceae bacterium]|nr:flagellar basal-body MS-ring/collar protein FliF [Syntrophobacteraceae bacterium]